MTGLPTYSCVLNVSGNLESPDEGAYVGTSPKEVFDEAHVRLGAVPTLEHCLPKTSSLGAESFTHGFLESTRFSLSHEGAKLALEDVVAESIGSWERC